MDQVTENNDWNVYKDWNAPLRWENPGTATCLDKHVSVYIVGSNIFYIITLEGITLLGSKAHSKLVDALLVCKRSIYVFRKMVDE